MVCFPRSRNRTLFFKSAYNVQVIAEKNEPEEKLLSRFRREVFRAGVLQECRRRRFFENSHDRRKRKARDAARRNRKRFVSFDDFSLFVSRETKTDEPS